MKRMLTLSAFVLALSAWWTGCSWLDTPNTPRNLSLVLPDTVYHYADVQLPPHLLSQFSVGGGVINNVNFAVDFVGDDFLPRIGIFSNSLTPVTDEGATLGRVLFYDPQLSINNLISCGSCHKQANGFADPVKGSKGFGGKVTPRNSMAIVNPGLNNHLFWDSRASSLQELALMPIQNHIEMGMEEVSVLESKLAKIDYYPELFEKAYPGQGIKSELIANALSQFLASMVTCKSKFDQGFGTNFDNYTSLEKMGKDLFFSERTQCSSCHAGGNFAAPDFPGGEYGSPEIKGSANIGLDEVYADNGMGQGQFRIPSLRNIALTAPYMHDGRFNTLEQVVDQYNSHIQPHQNLDAKLRNTDGSPRRMNLNALEKKALVAFLKTLTDEDYVKDVKFSDPFVR